jgi:hypothetical protein
MVFVLNVSNLKFQKKSKARPRGLARAEFGRPEASPTLTRGGYYPDILACGAADGRKRDQMDHSDIPERIAAYFGRISAQPNHRYRSWEHCFRFFRAGPTEIGSNLDVAALQLGFYLASWGMYRGSSFLLQRDYSVHKATVQALCSNSFAALWEHEIETNASNEQHADLILQAARAVRGSYQPFGNASDTLVSKVLLGTVGCLPACDRFFIDGFKRSGNKYSYLNARFVRRMIAFCIQRRCELQEERLRIASASGVDYPLMKLADMYFWQVGFEAAGEPAAIEP